MAAVLGKTEKGTLKVDVKTLISTRMLIQANSGGGKSYAIRKLLEETHGAVQQIVLDPEDEFSSLREKFDYLICAPRGGDVIATPQTATVLARTLLELGTSAIISMYDLKAHERPRFVRLFLEAMMNVPKKLWHPVMTVIDEAHVYCPEKGKAESTGAVIDLATRGRKRGYCAVLATQRLSKLHKDTAAELLNKLIGRTGLDIDIKRAADELGMTPKDAIANLRPIKAGTFFAFGPALSLEVERVVIGKVKTSHPEAGKMADKKTPPPTVKVKKILANIGDLAKKAEEEARTIADFKKENAELKRKLTVAGKQGGGIAEREVERKVKSAVAEVERNHRTEKARLVKENELLNSVVASIGKEIGRHKGHMTNMKKAQPVAPIRQESAPRAPVQRERTVSADIDTNLRAGAVRILRELSSRCPAGYTKSQVGALTGFKHTGGTFNTYMSDLRRSGYIKTEGSLIHATEEGIEFLGDSVPATPATHDEVMALWRKALREGAYKMLEVIVDSSTQGISKEELAAQVGIASSGGTFNTYISNLRSNGLIHTEQGVMVAADILFPESARSQRRCLKSSGRIKHGTL